MNLRQVFIVISVMILLAGHFDLAGAYAMNTVTSDDTTSEFYTLTENLRDTSTLVLQKTVDNTSPDPGEPFNYTLDMACNSTSRDCESAMVIDCLDPDLVFINLSDPLPDGVSSAVYDPVTHCVTILFDASNCASCTPDGINTDEDDFAQGSTVQILIQVMFPLGTFTGTTAENTIIGTTGNAGNPSASSNTTTLQSGTTGQTGCDAIPSHANVPGSSLVAGGQWQGRARATNLSPDDIADYVITTTLPDGVTFTHILGPDLDSGLCTDIDVYYERSDLPGTWIFHKTIDSCSEEEITVADLGLPPGVVPTAFQFDYGILEGDGSWNPDTWTTIYINEIRLFGVIDSDILNGTPISYCNTIEGTVGAVNCSDSICDFKTVGQGNDVIDGSKKIFDDALGFQIGDTYRVGLTYTSPEVMLTDVEGAYMLDVLPHCMEYVPDSWFVAWGDNVIGNQVPVVNTGFMPDGREYVEFIWDESLGNNFIIPGTGFWTAFQVRFDVLVTGSCAAGLYQNEYYFGTTGNDLTTNCGGDIPIGNLGDYANAATYVTNGELCLDLEEIEIILPPGSAGLDSHKSIKGALDTDFVQFPQIGETYAGGEMSYKVCLDNPNPVPVNDIVIVDIFPHIGDTEILNPEVPRGSEWTPVLTAPISVPAGFTVEYTTVANPCRDELASLSDPTPFPTGCTPAGWSTTPPADLSTVTGMRIDYGSTTINQGEQFCLQWTMTVPEDAPLDAQAFNSFAFLATNASTGSPLLPAEPIKVGVDILPPPCEIFEVDAGPLTTFCQGENGTLIPEISFGLAPFTYAWTGPGGFMSSDQIITVSEEGTYAVVITDASGCIASDSLDVVVLTFEVDAGPNLSFCDTVTVAQVLFPAVSAGTPPYTYSWTGPGTFSYNDVSPIVTVGGTYTLAITDADGCTVTDEVEVFVFNCDQTSPCHYLDEFNPGGYFGSDGSLDWSDVSWDESGDDNSSGTGNVMILAGRLLMENDDDTPPSIQRRVDLSTHSSAFLSFDFWGEGSLMDEDVFMVEVFDGTTWHEVFTFGGAIVGSHMPSLDISPYISSDTEIRLSIVSGFSDFGELLLLDNIRIDVDCLCEGIADAGIDVVACQGDSIQLMGVGGVSYSWTPAAGLSDSQVDNPFALPEVTTTYELTVTDENGCTDTDEVTVTINENVEATAVELSSDLCLDGSGEATVTVSQGNAPYTIDWQTSEGQEQGTAILNEDGSYTITNLNGGTTYCIQVTDANGCKVETP